MGTNFYWISGKQPCKECGRVADDAEMHIGKSSAGWAFALRIHPDKGIKNLYDWIRIFAKGDGYIKDEYGKEVATRDMLNNIMNRSHPMGLNYSRTNNSKEGTWDYHEGEFS